MARGWESKSIEEQIDAAGRRKSEVRQPPPSAQQIERESLMLQRKRVMSLIERSGNARFIEQQRKALAYLEAKLKALE